MGPWLLQFCWSLFLKIGITLACFGISGKVPNEKDKFISSDIGLNKHFLKSLRILVGTLPGPAVLYVFSVRRMSSTSSFVMGDKKKEFSFGFFKYELKDLGVFGILLTRFFATDVKKLLKWFELVRSSVIISLSIFRLILLENFSFFTLIIDRMLSHTFLIFFIILKKWFVIHFFGYPC